MKITEEFLKKESACFEGVEWFLAQKESAHEKVINSLMKQNHFNWANWLIVRLMSHPQKIQYAIFAAEQVIEIFEKKYPDEKRPRKAIDAAKEYLKDPSETNKAAADYAAANAADYAAYATANAAAYAAYATANAAANATYAAYAADYAAANATYATAKRKKLREKIIKNGLDILKGEPR